MQYNLYESNDFIQKNNIINKLNNQYQNSNSKEKDVNHFSKNIKVIKKYSLIISRNLYLHCIKNIYIYIFTNGLIKLILIKISFKKN